MKENNKQVVFYSAEKDGFLESYKDKGSLVFKAVFETIFGKHYSYRLSFTKNKKTSSTNLLRRLVVKCLSWKPNTM